MTLDCRKLVRAVEATVESHALGPPGAYRRGLPDEPEAPNPYGCADAANLLYTIGRLPRDPGDRASWVESLRAFQDPESGLFREETHHPIHTTAHCVAGLELFDARPDHALADLAPLRDPAELVRFLEGLDWEGSPWTESHKGAGVYAALVLAGEVGADWEARYFAWLCDEADPETGLLRRGCLPPLPEGAHELFPHLAGTFHYLFNLQHARRPLRHPRALVDTCLRIFEEDLFPLARFVGFAEIDWVYCLWRAVRECGHRLPEAQDALLRLAERHVDFLEGLDPERDEDWNDLHRLFGAVCALAELQQAVPGLIRTERPLRLVLDRRPFI